MQTPSRISFSSLDKEAGHGELPVAGEDEYPLPAWYRAVHDTPLEELSELDICRACQQGIHLEHVVPIAVRMLQIDPMAGDCFDGQLMVALESVPSEYWRKHMGATVSMYAMIESVLHRPEVDEEIRLRVIVLRGKLGGTK